jgi:hypothetical protein
MALADDLDRLYQLPLNEFTAARNDLAKRAGAAGADVKTLTKPPLAAWAVNQLYWQDRETYDALIEAAEALRATHKSVLGGKRGDLRAAGKDHDEAVERALKSTLSILADSGNPVTDATKQAVAQTLRALPAADAPGRLSRALQPGGFEMLAGITVRGGARPASPAPAAAQRARKAEGKHLKGDAAAEKGRQKEQEAREDATIAARELRAAEHAAQRAEFESARAARASEKADQQLSDARAELEAARTRVQDADAAAAKAKRQLDGARRAAQAAERERTSARKRAEAAEDKLARLKPAGASK